MNEFIHLFILSIYLYMYIDADALRAYVAALTDPTSGIPLGTRRVRLTTYRNCFSGADGAKWFMDNMEVCISL